MSESDADDDPSAFHDRLDDIEEDLKAAETEDDLDEIEADIETFASDLEAATLPKPPEPEDEDEEAPPDPREELEDRLDDLRDELESQRGPYASDVLEDLANARASIADTEWAEEGRDEVAEVVIAFRDTVADTVGVTFDDPVDADVDVMTEALERAETAIESAALDPDADAEAIATLLDATSTLQEGIDDATAFGDLPVREQLNRQGFFDVLGHYKDFPPEWSALKVHEEERNVEMILLAFELLDSNFMEEHCIDALRRLGDERAVEPMMGLAQRRNKDAIEVLGKTGSEAPIEPLYDYIETDSDPQLQQVSLKALGEIGSEEATEAVAQQLKAENEQVRSHAARALGMIGDPRAIDPLETVLEEDEAAPVRGSAAWALIQIGTAEALDAVRPFADDGSYLVEAEAAKAGDTAEVV